MNSLLVALADSLRIINLPASNSFQIEASHALLSDCCGSFLTQQQIDFLIKSATLSAHFDTDERRTQLFSTLDAQYIDLLAVESAVSKLRGLLALRQLAIQQHGAAQLRCSSGELFRYVRLLMFPAEGQKPSYVLIGPLLPQSAVVEIPLPAQDMLRFLRIEYEAGQPLPYLSCSVESSASQGRPELGNRWLQQADEEYDLSFWLRSITWQVSTRVVVEPVNCGSAGLRLTLQSSPHLQLVQTRVFDERGKARVVLLRMFSTQEQRLI